MHTANHVSDPRRPDREHRFKQPVSNVQIPGTEDLTPDYMNILGMIFSMCGLMMRLKWYAMMLSSWAVGSACHVCSLTAQHG